jgi:hypothetical protein
VPLFQVAGKEEKSMEFLNWKTVGVSLGLFLAISYVLKVVASVIRIG